MSTVRTYLVIVFTNPEVPEFDPVNNPSWMFALPYQQTPAVLAMQEMHLFFKPVRTEQHLCFELLQPLTQGQLWGLEQLKKRGLFDGFYVKDEITAEQHKSIDELRGPA